MSAARSPTQRRAFASAAPVLGAAPVEEQKEESPSPAHLAGQDIAKGIERLADRANDGDLTLQQAMDQLNPAPPLLVCALFALPFCQPVPTVGLGLPFGLAIACVGVALALGKEPRLPRWLAQRQLPSQVFPAILRFAARLTRWAESKLKRRGSWLVAAPLARIWALALVLGAVLLSLPLPIPFSNFFPAASILAISLGWLKGDGLAIGVGLVSLLLAVVFLLALALLGRIGLSLVDSARSVLFEETIATAFVLHGQTPF
ncbi:exopolysaccharide biosynthesis protein [Pelagicoccus sp. SDUM812003]|uniref:exopolysaccharide biosynthesis protein n=1 Tax=Pelagicoccus sp. SDUM812003 TaxID=3041267 RepID=UPI00280FEF25|nr:exopolysaccharide biosynthesis protein [Pelagicoccus sp. SDUM812003]MDQ8202580.1 exopolysaccharide biosynthesis protein [Pelagicoccus sp. SDUM812003]